MDFSLKDFKQLKRVEEAVMLALTPFRNGRTEAALVVMALLRCARVLLWLYPEATRQTLTPLLVAFLKGETQMPGVADADKGHPLWLPPARN